MDKRASKKVIHKDSGCPTPLPTIVPMKDEFSSKTDNRPTVSALTCGPASNYAIRNTNYESPPTLNLQPQLSTRNQPYEHHKKRQNRPPPPHPPRHEIAERRLSFAHGSGELVPIIGWSRSSSGGTG